MCFRHSWPPLQVLISMDLCNTNHLNKTKKINKNNLEMLGRFAKLPNYITEWIREKYINDSASILQKAWMLSLSVNLQKLLLKCYILWRIFKWIFIFHVLGVLVIWRHGGRGFTKYSLACGETTHARREAAPHAHSWMDRNVSAEKDVNFRHFQVCHYKKAAAGLGWTHRGDTQVL